MARYQLTWRPIAGGELAIGHRPGKKLRKALDESGCTLVVNLLSETESSASQSETRVRLPLAGANPPGSERNEEVRALFERMRTELEAGGRVYLHCSAGLHRTGMIGNAFMRWLGLSPEAALAQLRELRPLTADEVGTERLAWGEQFARER